MMALLSVGSVNGMFRVVICSQYTLELTIIVSFYTAVIRLDVVSIMWIQFVYIFHNNFYCPQFIHDFVHIFFHLFIHKQNSFKIYW